MGSEIEMNGCPVSQQHTLIPFSVVSLKITETGFTVVDAETAFAFHIQHCELVAILPLAERAAHPLIAPTCTAAATGEKPAVPLIFTGQLRHGRQ